MRPLVVKVQDDRLVFEVGIDILCMAAQHLYDEWHFQETGELESGKGMVIADKEAFAQSVARELDGEDPDDGSSPLTRLLVEMFKSVADNGDMSITDPRW